MADVVLKNISKSYDKKKILNNVNLDIKDKEFIVIVGSSGCGKSTLLRMIAGLENITEGEILIGNQCVNDVHPKDRDIAFVFQNYALYPHMSVYDNIAFPLKMRKIKKEEIKQKVLEVAKTLDLEELLDRKPKQLSGGQRQRVALGRAMVRNPKVFLMDEPLSNLDAKLRVQMRSNIKKLHQKLQTTFIYVTHDQTEALTMGDRIALIDKGIIQQIGEPQEIYNHPANIFVAGFLGSPSMNFIDAEIKDNKLRFFETEFELSSQQKELLKDKKEVIMGIRPDCMYDEKADVKFVVNVDICEILGSEKIVYFNENNKKFCAKIPNNVKCEQQAELKFNKNNILFFDKETNLRI